jgi:hypothetical protein
LSLRRVKQMSVGNQQSHRQVLCSRPFDLLFDERQAFKTLAVESFYSLRLKS